jgi:hypothetical protein
MKNRTNNHFIHIFMICSRSTVKLGSDLANLTSLICLSTGKHRCTDLLDLMTS